MGESCCCGSRKVEDIRQVTRGTESEPLLPPRVMVMSRSTPPLPQPTPSLPGTVDSSSSDKSIQPVTTTSTPLPVSSLSLTSEPVKDAPVSVQKKGSVSLGSVDRRPEVFFVIIGCGPAAVIDHSTIRQSTAGEAKERLAGLKVLHIGFPNPWPKYLRHGMGQPWYLLSLPGFETQPYQVTTDPEREVDSGFNSRNFGAAVDRELSRLKSVYAETTSVLPGWVLWIQSFARKETPDGPFYTALNDEIALGAEITAAAIADDLRKKLASTAPTDVYPPDVAPYRLFVLPDGAAELVVIYAAFIDICTGPGRPQVIGPDVDPVKHARTPPWIPGEAFSEGRLARRVLNGVDAIREECVWRKKERVCVSAGGGVALNVAEKARENECYLDWFARTGLFANTFEANPRNDTFLKYPGEDRRMAYGDRRRTAVNTEVQLIPYLSGIRFGQLAELDSTVLSDTSVTVAIKGGAAEMRDMWTKSVGLESGEWRFSGDYQGWAADKPRLTGGMLVKSKDYDRLVIPTGQQTNLFGQPSFFAKHLVLTPLVKDGRMIAVNTADGKVRLLGAAAQAYPNLNYGAYLATPDTMDAAARKMWEVRAALPASTVPDGFILSGHNIAVANGYFDGDRKNTNLNTMTQEEIDGALKTALPPEEALEIAKAIVAGRNANNGYKDPEDLAGVLFAKLSTPTGASIVDPLLAEGAKLKLQRMEKVASEIGLRFAYL